MRSIIRIFTGLVMSAALCTVSASAQELGKVRITGVALNLSITAAGATQNILIDIDQWSPPATRTRLIESFLKDKQDGLLKALRDQPKIGEWRFPGYMGPDRDGIYRAGSPIRYAAVTPREDGGQRIIIMTDRVITMKEQASQPRSMNYPFTLIELHFDKAGNGEGVFAWFTRLNLDEKQGKIEIENYGTEPVNLKMLKLEPRK